MDWSLIVEWLIKAVVLVLVLLTGFAYLTLFERRVLAFMQVRIGPNRAGWEGLLQPVADAVKLIFKEELIPDRAEKLLFVLAPIVTVVPAVVIAAVVPWGPTIPFPIFGRTVTLYIADVSVGVLYITAIASIAVYGIVLAGWASNNKYAMLGGLRSSAQMISYELALGLAFVTATLLAGSLQITQIVAAQKDVWFVVVQPVTAIIFFVATLAEVNRSPFDMPEAEQELTAGYHTEYSGMKFALFFMAEYIKMIVISAVAATLFFGGYREFWFLKDTILSVDQTWWLGPIYMFAKVITLLFLMVWIRATLPRIRYDRLMALGWKVMLPLALAEILISAMVLAFQWPWWINTIISLIPFAFAVLMVDRELTKKQRRLSND